jgi:hypothetical protein
MGLKLGSGQHEESPARATFSVTEFVQVGDKVTAAQRKGGLGETEHFSAASRLFLSQSATPIPFMVVQAGSNKEN